MKCRYELCIFLWIFFNISTSYGIPLECNTQQYDWLCNIYNLNLSRDDTIEPFATNATEITQLKLSGSIPVLKGNFCETFPNLDQFKAKNVGLEEIAEDTFYKCRKLNFLELEENKIKKLHQKSFRGLYDLNYLYFTHGSMPITELELPDSHNLKTLNLANCNISSFSPEIFRRIRGQNLRSLFLDSNNLFDLDIEEIFKLTPSLYELRIMDNNFKCSRLAEMISIIQQRRLDLHLWFESIYVRNRTYTTENINRIHCLENELWEIEYAKYNTNGAYDQNNTIAQHEKSFEQRLCNLEHKVETLVNFLEDRFSTKIEANHTSCGDIQKI